MKLLFALFALTLSLTVLLAFSPAAHAAPATYVCQVTEVASEAIAGQLFSDNLRGKAIDCSPKDLAGLTTLFFKAPAAARADLEAALRDGTKVALTTPEPTAYGGTIIAVNGHDVGALGTTEYAQLYILATSRETSSVQSEVQRVLNANSVARVPRTDHSHGKTLNTWGRELSVKVASDLEISFNESGRSLSYGAIHPPSSAIRIEYLKSARGDVGRVLNASESALVLHLLKARLPYQVKGERISSGNASVARFTKTADGRVQVSFREAL